MKRIIPSFILTFMLAASSLMADLDSGIFGSEKMAKPQDAAYPFSVYASYDNVCSSNFQDKKLKNQSQRYSEAEAEVGAIFYHNACYQEGAKAKIGYTYTVFDWKQNPFFHQDHFNMASIELGFATKRVTDWLWQANISMNVDTDHFQINKYANYDFLLWGRYDWNCAIGFHTGFLAYTGMKVDRVWPIIGFDWCINRKWKLNAIFPMNMSLVYKVTPAFSASLAGRLFYNRYRAGSHEPVPQAIFEYQNRGLELGLSYECASWLSANAHLGYTFGGQTTFSNKNRHHRQHLDIDGACYFGGNVSVKF